MLAIELSGIHIGQMAKITYRFPSWPKGQKDSIRIVRLTQVEHRMNGNVHFNKDQYSPSNKFYTPYSAVVELIPPKKEDR